MPTTADAAARSAYADAAAAFVQLVQQVPAEAWGEPGLGVWTVRDLVGHTSRSLTTVETYLGKPAAGPQLDDAVAYFTASQSALADADAVAQRGRDAGAALGDDPAGFVAALARRVTALVAATADDEPVGTPIGPMTLAAYLPTRVFELSVHSLDLARAIAVPPPAALRAGVEVSCALAGRLAAASPHADTVLLGLTGRVDLPARFSLV